MSDNQESRKTTKRGGNTIKTKTVRLSDDYELIDDGSVARFVCVKRAEFDYSGDPDDPTVTKISDEEWGYVPTKYEIGAQVMLVSHEDVSPNALRRGDGVESYSLVFGAPDGIGGNSNRNIKRYHGWRGTTCDTSCHAHGLREIVNIRTLKNGRVAVTVGPDIKPEEE